MGGHPLKALFLAGGVAFLAAGSPAQAANPIKNVVGVPQQSGILGFNVFLPLRNTDKLEALVAAQQNPNSASYLHWLTPAQFASQFGPDAAAMSSVSKALQARGFAVVPHSRSLRVTGPASLIESTFGTKLALVKSVSSKNPHVVAMTALKVPAELAAAGAIVPSFAGHEAHTMSRVVTGALPESKLNRESTTGGYWYNDLKQAYVYPSYQTMVTVNGKTQRLDGTGVTLGVLMSSDALDSDLAAMFDHEHWTKTTGLPDPKIYQHVTVDGGGGVDGPAFDEASLDVQQELGGAPGAHVMLYNIPDLSDDEIMAGYTQIIDDNKVDLVSSSFGGCELGYLPAYNGGEDFTYVLIKYHELFLQGNALGITFLASSGDEAGLECPTVSYYVNGQDGTFVPSVSTPASDPNVVGVGGTNLVTTYSTTSKSSKYVTENAWGDPETPYDIYGIGANVSGGFWGAGGGASAVFSAPGYQGYVTTGSKSRMVPDIGMQVGGCPGGISIVDPKTNFCDGENLSYDGNGNADRSYVITAIDGSFYGLIGTSVSSPEMASAIALYIETHGRQGNINWEIYHLANTQKLRGLNDWAFHNVVPGYNGVIQSGVSSSYNVSTGVGTPNVKLATTYGGLAAAGVPQTASNP